MTDADLRERTGTVKLPSLRDYEAALTEAARLRAAIERHQLNVWGTGPVQHPEDVALYVAAGLPAEPTPPTTKPAPR